MTRNKHINGKEVTLPLKTVPDTLKRQYRSLIDSQNLGKPDMDGHQAEEYRTRIKLDHLERVRAEKTKESEKKDLARKLQSPGSWLSDAAQIGYFPATKEVREELTTVDYVNLIDIAYRAEMDVVVVPPFYEKEPEEIRNIIYSMIDYAENALNGEIKVAPNFDLNMAPQILEEIMEYVEGNYTEEEVPMISVRGFYPLSATGFGNLREMTDRIIYVASCRRKINWRKQDPHRGDEDAAFGKVSAEVLLAAMEADIIGRFYHLGGYPGDDEGPIKVTEMQEEMFNHEEALYNDVELNTVDRVPCQGCVICDNFAEENLIDYFGSQSQQKLMEAMSIHNELSVIKLIADLQGMDADEREEWIRARSSLLESLQQVPL